MNAGGGGGGWFGGYSGIGGASGGGGGSGFVFTSPNDLCYFPSSFLLTKSFTQGGNSVFGNLGNGIIYITYYGQILSCHYNIIQSFFLSSSLFFLIRIESFFISITS